MLEQRHSQRSGQPMRRRIFPEDKQELRWSRFKELGEAASMFQVVGERVFPFLRELGGEESAYATHMRDARFTIPTPALLTKGDIRACAASRQASSPSGPQSAGSAALTNPW